MNVFLFCLQPHGLKFTKTFINQVFRNIIEVLTTLINIDVCWKIIQYFNLNNNKHKQKYEITVKFVFYLIIPY